MMNRRDATDAAPHMSEQRTTPTQCMVKRTELQSLLCTCSGVIAEVTSSPERYVTLTNPARAKQL